MPYPSSFDTLVAQVPTDVNAPTTTTGDATLPLDNWARNVSTAVETVETELGLNPRDNVVSASVTVVAGSFRYVPDYLEIADTFALTLDDTAIVEVG